MGTPSLRKCIECGFPTRETWKILPLGREHALCRKCSIQIPKRRNPYEQIIDADHALGKGKPRENYKVSPELRNQVETLRKAGLTYVSISEKLELSVGTVFKICRGLD